MRIWGVVASVLLFAISSLVWASEASDQIPIYVTNQTDFSVSHLSLMNTPGSLSSTRIGSQVTEKPVGYVQVDQKTGVQFSFNHDTAQNFILYNSVLLPSDLRKSNMRRIDLLFFPSMTACQQYAYVGGICPVASPTAYMHCFPLSPGAVTGPAVGSAVCLISK